VPVLLPVMLDQCYDYLLPEGMEPAPGSFVQVPFGPQRRIGVVWDKADDGAEPVAVEKLKAVLDVLDVPALPPVSLRFVEWVSRYTLAPRGMVLRLMMSAPDVFASSKPRFGVQFSGVVPPKMTDGRKRVLDIARDGQTRTRTALAEEAGVGAGVITGLIKSGALVQAELPHARYRAPNPDHAEPEFDGDQTAAVMALRSAAEARRFSVSLLDGVTGSGKTEVYFEAAAETLRQGRQVLVMLPEIALTGQFLTRFEKRFGIRPLEWHSAIGGAERARIWRAVAEGEARAVIGARSALFLPYSELGLIVVDEEHDTSFKQDDRVNYQARDMAAYLYTLGDVR